MEGLFCVSEFVLDAVWKFLNTERFQ